MKKIKLYRYTYKIENKPAIKQTHWNNGSWFEQAHPNWNLLYTESKEIGVGDLPK